MTATPEALSDWEKHVWMHVETEYETLKTKNALGKAEGAVGTICNEGTESHMKELTKNLTEHSEYRYVVSNICQTPPTMTSVPGDAIIVEVLPDMARYRFFKDGKPFAPAVWPRDCAIAVALYCCELPLPGQAERFGKDGVVQAFWWAFAQAVKQHKAAVAADAGGVCEALQTLEGFRKLARNCHFDYRLFKTKEERDVAAFQELENVEEARERFGFTGTRKINLIMWAEDLLKGKNNGKEPDDEEIAKYLREHIKWTDEKKAPTKNVVINLRALAKVIKNQPEIAKATQMAETQFGRATLFDEYSKYLVLVRRARSTADALWLVRSFVAAMMRQARENVKPEICSQSELTAKTGIIPVYQKIKDAQHWLAEKYKFEAGLTAAPAECPPPVWLDPLAAALFDEADFAWVKVCSESQRRLYNIQKKLLEAGPEVLCVLKGLLATPPPGGFNVEKHVFEAIFKEKWKDFLSAWESEHNPDVAEKVDEKATGEAGLTAPDPAGLTAAPTSAGDEVSGDEKKAALKKEIVTEALWHS